MSAHHPSVVQGELVVVRMLGSFTLRGRKLQRHGQHFGLVALPIQVALRLVESGHAKPAGGVRRGALREAAQ